MVPAQAVAFLVGASSVTVGVAIATIVINLVISAILGKLLAPDLPKTGRDTKGLQTTIRSNITPRRIIYGESVVGGPYALLETSGTDNEFLNMIVVLAGHPVDDIIGVFIDDQYADISGTAGTNDLTSNYWLNTGKYGSGNHVRIIKNNGWGYADNQYVTDGSDSNTDVLQSRTAASAISAALTSLWNTPVSTTRDSQTGLYESGYKLTNCAHVYLRFVYDRDIWSGFPKVKFLVRGKRLYNPYLDINLVAEGADSTGTHDINDPDTWTWSEDWTLCVLDYLLNTSYGLAAKITGSLTEIDWAEAISSYLSSSENITNGLPSPDTATGPRYTINGVLETNSTPISNMEALLTSGAGQLIYAQGKYKIRPGIYREPESPSNIINEDMLVSSLNIRTHTPRSELFNKAAGVFVDKGYDEASGPGNTDTTKPKFEPTDFEIVDPLDSTGNNPYEIIDGEEIIREFDFPFTTREFEAQRLARIQLERVRRGFTVSFEANMQVLKYSVGDTVYLEILSNSKYANESFYNRLGLDDSVQIRPDSPGGLYYKQFKIVDMQYTEKSTIMMTMIEEASEIYEWSEGYAVKSAHALISEIAADDPTGTVLSPSFVVNSPYVTVEEDIAATSGTTVTTLIRWSAPDRGSLVNAIDRAHISFYELEYGIVTDPSASSTENRVAQWITGKTRVSNHSQIVQGPISLETLYKDGSLYDFRVRGITYSGRASNWAYYSVDIGSDYDPSAPPTAGNGISAYLSDEARTITAENNSLTYTLPTNPVSQFYVFDGSTDITDTSNVTFSVDSPDTKNGLTISISDTIGTKGQISLSGAAPSWTSSAEYFQLRASYNGNDYIKIYSISKALKGDTGIIFYATADSETISAESDGTGYTLPTNPVSQIKLFDNGVDVTDTSAVTYSVDSPDTKNGLTISVSDTIGTKGEVSLSGASPSWTSNAETFTIRATYNGTDYIKTYSISKAIAGRVGWGHDLVFSSTDSDTVAWSTGNIWTASGTTYSINSPAGDTGNMTARTYIYLDSDVSTTSLQTTTNAQNAVGDSRILIAVAENVTTGAEAFFQVFGGRGGMLITGNEIVANSIVANNIASSFYTGRQFTGGTFQTRAPNNSSPYPGTPRAVVQETDPQIAIYSNDGASGDVQIFGITDIGGGQVEISIVGDFVAGSLDTAQMYSSAGITDLRGRLGVTAPSSPTGGIATLTNIPQNLNGAASSEDFELDVNIFQTGLDQVTFTVTIYDYAYRTGPTNNPYTAPVWDLNFFYTDDITSPITWTQVPGADWTVTGTTNDTFLGDDLENPFWANSFSLNATRQANWTPGSPFTSGDTIYFMIRTDRISGSYNTPKLNACNASEPVSGGSVQSLGDLTDVNLTGAAIGDLLYKSGSDTWSDTNGALTWDGTHFILPQDSDVVTPSLGFGDGTRGILSASSSLVTFSTSGSSRCEVANNEFRGINSTSYVLINEAVTGTNPTISARRGDYDTGLGSNAADQLSGIAGGVEILRLVEGTDTYAKIFTPLFITESASASADIAGDGQFWVRNNTPNDPYYTDDSGLDYKVGFGSYRLTSADTLREAATETISAIHMDGAWWKSDTGAHTLTLETTTSTNFEVGSQLSVWNAGASGNLTITEGASGTLYIMDGSNVTEVTSNSLTVPPGAYGTLIRETTAIWRWMGAGAS